MNNKEQAEEVFKKISQAYAILSDAKKRQEYDAYGRDYVLNGGMQSGSSGPGFSSGFQNSNFNMASADEIFRRFFGDKDPFASFFDDEDDFFGGFTGLQQ